MKFYKSPNGDLFAYEDDGSQDEIIPSEFIKVSANDANKLIEEKRKAEFDALGYAEKRVSEYPPMSDYLDGIVKNDQAQINKYIADCLAVKAKYPKPVTVV